MKIILIRHFATKGNLEKRYIGRTDESLWMGEKEREQARRLRRKCQEVSRVIVSPLRRCVETASLIYPKQQPYIRCSQLKECDFGLFEGKNYEDLKINPEYIRWLKSRGTLPFPEGEGHEAFKERCQIGFDKVVLELIREKQECAAMVVHGGTIMSILSGYDRRKREFYSWQLKNSEAYLVSLDDKEWVQGKKYFEEIEKI